LDEVVEGLVGVVVFLDGVAVGLLEDVVSCDECRGA
jgi:hypothetical protein